MLQPSSPSKYNAMTPPPCERHNRNEDVSHATASLGNTVEGVKVPHPASTRFLAEAGEEGQENGPEEKRAAKRIKLDPSTPAEGKRVMKDEIPDSDVESGNEEFPTAEDEVTKTRATDLEAALPSIIDDKEAIEAYEASRYDHAETSQEDQRTTDSGGKDTSLETIDTSTLYNHRLASRSWRRGRSSIYVDAFNLALDTVLEQESHLFDPPELAVFTHWKALPYEAQYVYVRLFLRKTAAWFRIGRLGYYSDVGDLEGAVRELQIQRELPVAEETEEDEKAAVFPGGESTRGEVDFGDTFTFADRSDECIRSLEEASSLLYLDELKAFAKDAKVQGKNKRELLAAFRRTSGRQKGLGFSSMKRSDTEETTCTEGSAQDESGREDTPGRLENRDAYWVGKIMAETGPCVRLSLPTFRLFERVHLVFYRSTEWTEKSLTTIILAGIARRNFPEYIVSRSANIFGSRTLLLEFEAAVRTQFRIDNILEFNGTPTKDSFQTIIDLFETVYPRWKVLLAEEQQKEDSIYATGEGAYLRRLSPAWVYTRIVHKAAYALSKFKDYVREHQIMCDLLDQRLFHTSRRGDWYQRKALLEEHYMYLHLPSPPSCKDSEAKKKFWKRRALQTCEMGLEDHLTHLIFHRDLQRRTTKLEKALKIPKRQQHEFAHVRLTAPAERTFTGTRIERSSSVGGAGTGTGCTSRRNSDQAVSQGRAANGGNNAQSSAMRGGGRTIWLDPEVSLRHRGTHTPRDDASPDENTSEIATATKLTDTATDTATNVVQDDSGDGDEGECTVEEMCLSSYRALGWKGYHSEGGIVRTLFAYLFYDVLFVYIPNVFQTAFQTCPLDLHTDAFYPSRLSEIHARLNAISNGHAPSIIQTVWDAHHERRTCVVGLDWTFALEDLLEITHCFPPAALSTVMKVMAQEYGQRGGGVPDLFLWRTSTASSSLPSAHAIQSDESARSTAPSGEVLFAEVKSENDRLSDTQRMWIDLLRSSGVSVELCHAVASEVRVRG